LIACIEAYHDSLREALASLEPLADRVARERLAPMRLLDRLQRRLAVLDDSLRTHLIEQDCRLFPMIRELCKCLNEPNEAGRFGDVVEQQMDEATSDNDEAVAMAQVIDQLVSETEWEIKRPLVIRLVRGLRSLRTDWEEHARLESKVLFPAVRELLHGDYEAAERFLDKGTKSQTAASADETKGVSTTSFDCIPCANVPLEPSGSIALYPARQERTTVPSFR
jgi:iron-sulfur cluster repair protein YtfE (RIC family)